MLDDTQLIGRFTGSDDSAAFGVLVERHLGVVYRTALRLVGGDAHGAEDVTQAVFILLAQKARGLREHGSLAGWLYVATRKKARELRRADERRRKREEGAMVMNEISGDEAVAAKARADWDNVRPVLDEALGELSATDREVVLLRFFGGKAFAEIGAALRLNEDAARMRVSRALEKLRGLLERRGVKSTSAALAVAMATDTALGAPAGLAATVSQSALAAGTASFAAGVGVGVIGFMGAIKTVGVVAVLIATTLFVGVEVSAKRRAEAALADARSAYAALAKKTEEREAAVKLDEQEAARRAEEKARIATAVAKAEKEKPKEDPVALGDAFIAKSPELKQALIAEERARVVLKYLPFYRELELTAEQRAQFEEIQLSNEIRGLSMSDGRVSLRIPRRLRSAERNQRLKALLGDEGYQALGRFEQTIGARAEAERTAALLFDGGAPVTQEQGKALTEVFGREKGTPGMTATQYWEKIRAEASQFLSPEQLSVLAVKQFQAEAAWANQQAAKRSLGK
jgi:RNA polymerase sigma factor (sigma-70 family)